jgi:hypothetical protein
LILDGILISFSAWAGTQGIIFYYFGTFSPVTIIANLFIAPLASFITAGGFYFLIFSFLFTPIAWCFAKVIEIMVALLLNLNLFFMKIPYAYFSLRK